MRRIHAPTFSRVDERGSFVEVLNAGRWEALLHGRMKRGSVIGNHYHERTEVFLFLTEGRAEIKTVEIGTGERQQFGLEANQGVMLHTRESHAIRFLENSTFIMLKSLAHNPDDPDTFPHPVDPAA